MILILKQTSKFYAVEHDYEQKIDDNRVSDYFDYIKKSNIYESNKHLFVLSLESVSIIVGVVFHMIIEVKQSIRAKISLA